MNDIKKILVYTHNSIGLGHAFRIRAVLSGIQAARPDVEFLVMSGTSIPHIFFGPGIEVVKLPSVKLDIDQEGSPLQPRYLTSFSLHEIFDFRQKLIQESFEFFKPDALIIEHNMTGQMSEMIPVVMKKWMRSGSKDDFALIYICRGIMKWAPFLNIPYQNPRHKSGSIDMGGLFDFIYVLEDRDVVDVVRDYLGGDAEVERKTKYLGKITNKTYEELPTRGQVLHRIGLEDKKIILVSLGRNLQVFPLSKSLLRFFAERGLSKDYQVVMVLDPYLDREAARALRNDPISRDVRFLPFVPDMVDLMVHSELIISRVGYNTFNEILMTGVKAILIPEVHGGGEQELRARKFKRENMAVLTEEEVFNEGIGPSIEELLSNPPTKTRFDFNKYLIGQTIMDDLESWKQGHNIRHGRN
ncbi:hypothetical protein GF413_04520 [Candidatus Micrarchaeota archaeon]|nr:hypothetical protein [Candidatus Micrarchaeota archaeon]